MPLRLIFDANDTTRQALIVDYSLNSTTEVPAQVRMDENIPLTVEPVKRNPAGSDTLYSPDHEATDTFLINIGIPGGEAALASASPNTQLPATGVTVGTVQSQTESENHIQAISFDADNTYGGTFSVSVTARDLTVTAGVARPTSTADELAAILARHPYVHFNDPDEEDSVAVVKSGSVFFVHWINDLGPHYSVIVSSSVATESVLTTLAPHGLRDGAPIVITAHSGSTPALSGTYQVVEVLTDNTFSINQAVTVAGTGGTVLGLDTAEVGVDDIDLVAPQGVSGNLDLTDSALIDYADGIIGISVPLYISIRRSRVSGSEVRTIFGPAPITLLKEIYD